MQEILIYARNILTYEEHKERKIVFDFLKNLRLNLVELKLQEISPINSLERIVKPSQAPYIC